MKWNITFFLLIVQSVIFTKLLTKYQVKEKLLREKNIFMGKLNVFFMCLKNSNGKKKKKFKWQKVEMNHLISKTDNKRSRSCSLNAGPLGTFSRNLSYTFLPARPIKRHTLPSAGWGCGLRS